ncbi:DUF2326 domain-containing protein [Bacillus sp. FJAT-44742]|uniref:DUF2326 domain-containing protein n=1 Tax=Bacillus sp. FJAT-44742 TaxID=2014005 RepID=UPI000C242046|nr:DUF2326 domain-containing protein [Bacillus sp. FJAT-44742]
MILKELYVFNASEERLIKNIKFNEIGVNIILGEKREDEDETNGVGKSTMVDCLSFLIGKSIPEFYSNNEQLLKRNIIIILEVEAGDRKLFLARAFNSPKYGYYLDAPSISFDLIEWEKYGIKKYKQLVEEIMFANSKEEDISFSALREYIIRDEKTGFNDIFLSNRNALNQHRLLSYLFTLPYKAEKNIKSYKDQIEKLNNEIKLIESMHINLGELKVKEEELTNVISEYDKLIKEAKTSDQYNEDSNKYSAIKKQLNKTQSEIFESEHIRRQYLKNISDLKEKVNEIKQLENIEGFYQDLVGYFPEEVKLNYEQVKEFYDFMVESRGSYFQDKISKLNSNLKKLYLKKEDLERELEERSKIFKSNTFIEDISIVMDNKRRSEIQLAEVRVRINDYNKKNQLFDKINDIQQEIFRVNSMHYEEFQAYAYKKEQIKSLFNELMEVTYDQSGFLEFEYDNRIGNSKKTTTGRIKITCSIPDERSHGRLHMKINIFDLSWFLYRCLNNFKLNFLIHDGSYSNPDPYVKGALLKYIDKKLRQNLRGQYFVTINKTELLEKDLIEFEEQKLIVAKLDRLDENNNRFFGFKF